MSREYGRWLVGFQVRVSTREMVNGFVYVWTLGEKPALVQYVGREDCTSVETRQEVSGRRWTIKHSKTRELRGGVGEEGSLKFDT